MTTKTIKKKSIPDIYAPLPWPEISVYVFIWMSALFYAIYKVWYKSTVSVEKIDDYAFDDGWSFLNRKKDVTDYEWIFWSKMLYLLTPSLIGHVIMGKILSSTFPHLRIYFFIIYSLLNLLLIMGMEGLLLILTYIFIMYTISMAKTAWLCWIVALLQITTLNFEDLEKMQRIFLKNEEQYYLTVFCLAACIQRHLSFALEKCNSETKREGNGHYTIFDMLAYTLYYPLFFCGPILTYDKFSQQVYKKVESYDKSEDIDTVKKLFRGIFWFLFIEFILHYFYFSAIQYTFRFFRFLSPWSLAGIGYCKVQFFQLKYFVMYSIPSSLALFDGIRAPKPPSCVSNLYLFTDMWRNFDQGLHEWLLRYIYIPLGGSRKGLMNQIFASIICFFYIYFWHGGNRYLFIWATFNWLGITLEMLSFQFYHYFIRSYLKTKISLPSIRRLHALFSVPNLVLLILSNLVFLGGENVGFTYFKRLVLQGWPLGILTLFGCLYCCIQTIIETNRFYYLV